MSMPIERWLVEFDALNNPDTSALVEKDALWPRFAAAKKAAILAIKSEKQQIITTESLEGGSKIIKHIGRINGNFDKIELDITIEGETTEGQPNLVEIAGQLTLVRSRESYKEIGGTYTSEDGRAGAMCIIIKDDKTYLEAYWLKVDTRSTVGLKLEQIKAGGKIFDVPDSENEQVAVPRTNLLLTRVVN